MKGKNIIIKFLVIISIATGLLLGIGYFSNNAYVRIIFFSAFVISTYFFFYFFHKNYFFKELKKIKKKTQENYSVKNLEELTKKNSEEIAQLKANERFRKEYIGNVAHELKTPIFNIQGFVLTLLDGAINDENVNVNYLERSEKNVQRLIAIVKDLDTISKLEAGTDIPNFETFDIKNVINEVLDVLREKANEFGIVMKAEFYGETVVVADKEKITEVVNNLVLNSIIYGRKNGLTKILVKEKKKKIVTYVIDNGIGINEEHLKHVFERFFRVDKSRSRERGGSGLGLAIVKHIIDSHNQTLSVDSKEGIGTSFYFSLSKANPEQKNNYLKIQKYEK